MKKLERLNVQRVFLYSAVLVIDHQKRKRMLNQLFLKKDYPKKLSK